MTHTQSVLQHYGQHDLTDRLHTALAAAGLDGKVLLPEDLAPLDQFHARGLAATVELAKSLKITRDTKVLDIGSGLGGPSRYLAATFGCQVQGIDLNPAFVEAATFLAQCAGLADKVVYRCANALSLPYDAGSFDAAWTQHVAMNIADRPALYAEAFRVLKPGGYFAIYDVMAGAAGPVHFPVPWSQGPETSFLMTPHAMRDLLEREGFRVIAWDDRTEAGVAWFAERQKAQLQASGASSGLGLHIAMGPTFPIMTANLGRSLRDGRATLLQAILERP